MPKKFMRSIKYAHAGTRHAFMTQRNIWIHAVIAVVVIGAAVWLKVSRAEMALLALTIGFVIAAELFNTALEEVVNLAKPEEHPQAAVAKNVSAGAVLLSAVTAAVVGTIIFLPRVIITLWK